VLQLEIKVLNIIDARCNHEVQILMFSPVSTKTFSAVSFL